MDLCPLRRAPSWLPFNQHYVVLAHTPSPVQSRVGHRRTNWINLTGRGISMEFATLGLHPLQSWRDAVAGPAIPIPVSQALRAVVELNVCCSYLSKSRPVGYINRLRPQQLPHNCKLDLFARQTLLYSVTERCRKNGTLNATKWKNINSRRFSCSITWDTFKITNVLMTIKYHRW